ncbi:hypothetical protein ACODYM_29250 [Burkholderia gladioli]|uniref:hypothetical protein n=1 Tax=Burkholderia gladioli TaxID=28095 RepID=UPI003B501074
MYTPNTTITVYAAAGYSAAGQALQGAASREPAAIVSVVQKSLQTPVSTTRDASHAGAAEVTADAVVLLGVNTKVAIDTVIGVAGATYRVYEMQPRISLAGIVDHYQISANIWKRGS